MNEDKLLRRIEVLEVKYQHYLNCGNLHAAKDISLQQYVIARMLRRVRDRKQLPYQIWQLRSLN